MLPRVRDAAQSDQIGRDRHFGGLLGRSRGGGQIVGVRSLRCRRVESQQQREQRRSRNTDSQIPQSVVAKGEGRVLLIGVLSVPQRGARIPALELIGD